MSRNEELFHRFKAFDLLTVKPRILNETSLFQSGKARLERVKPEAGKSPSLKMAALGFTASITFVYAAAFLLSTIV